VVRRDGTITGFVVHFRESAMSFDWSEYLDIARELAGQATASSSAEAKKRCAISRAYYAAFCSGQTLQPALSMVTTLVLSRSLGPQADPWQGKAKTPKVKISPQFSSNFLSERHERRSTLVTTNLAFSEWV